MAQNALTKKFGIKPGQRLLIMNAPDDYMQLLGILPEDTEVQSEAGGAAQAFDFVHAFVYNRADVAQYAPMALQALKPGGLLWFSYPKRSAKIKSDINRDTGWEPLYDAGIEPVTLISIDETWSALRFRPRSEIKSRA